MGIITSFINGIITFCKFYNYISHNELFLLIFLRVLITFILFFGLGLGVCFFLKQQIPQIFPKLKKPIPTKIDYILPSETTIGKSEEKKTMPEEVTKADAESLAMMIRTTMAQE